MSGQTAVLTHARARVRVGVCAVSGDQRVVQGELSSDHISPAKLQRSLYDKAQAKIRTPASATCDVLFQKQSLTSAPSAHSKRMLKPPAHRDRQNLGLSSGAG